MVFLPICDMDEICPLEPDSESSGNMMENNKCVIESVESIDNDKICEVEIIERGEHAECEIENDHTVENAELEVKNLDISSPKSESKEGIDNITSPECQVDEDKSVASSNATSSTSSSSSHKIFTPHYAVIFTNDVTKDGDVFKYKIKVSRLQGEELGKSWYIDRQYMDFQQLEQTLLLSMDTTGIIIPPLPPQPTCDPQEVETRSRKQLGNDSRSLLADEFDKDSQHLEKYLQLLLCHPVLGSNSELWSFVARIEAPPRLPSRRPFLQGLQNLMGGGRRKGGNALLNHQDCDEFFQRERERVQNYGSNLESASTFFNANVNSMQRLSGQMAHLATALNLCTGDSEGLSTHCNRLNARFSETFDDLRHILEDEGLQAELSLGLHLELFSRYIESESVMLQDRQSLLLAYEEANRSMDRAKPHKKELAIESQRQAEKAFDDCNDVARLEIKQFHRIRVRESHDALIRYAEARLKAANATKVALSLRLEKLKEFPCPGTNRNTSHHDGTYFYTI